MRRNREKFSMVVGRIRDLKRSYAREIEAAVRGATDEKARRIPRLAASILNEGKWLCSMCEKKLLSNGHKITKDEEKNLKAAQTFFDKSIADHEETVNDSGFISHLDAIFVSHLETTANLVLRLDAEEKARHAQALADKGIGTDDEEIEDEDAEAQPAAV